MVLYTGELVERDGRFELVVTDHVRETVTTVEVPAHMVDQVPTMLDLMR